MESISKYNARSQLSAFPGGGEEGVTVRVHSSFFFYDL